VPWQEEAIWGQYVETEVKLFFLFNFIILSNTELYYEFIILCNS
jgi:hypothetical protein